MTRIFVGAVLALTALSATAEPFDPTEKTVAELQAALKSGRLTSVELTNFYIDRILRLDQNGPGVNSVIELNPDALANAKKADDDRRKGIVKGPLQGLPVLLKDNIDTGDQLQTT